MSRFGFLVLAALLSAPCGAQELGRLFFSPAERAALDALRRAGAVAPEAAPAPAPMRIDGYVLRTEGRPIVWVNGSAASAGPRHEAMRVTPGADHPGEVAVSGRVDRSSRRVKVGSTLDAASGEVRDVIGDGQLRVRR